MGLGNLIGTIRTCAMGRLRQRYAPLHVALVVSAVLGAHAVADTTLQLGAIDGSFRVTPNGAASYSIPIAAAPGTQGAAPDLAVSYSSQGANGLAGVGWTLSGLSTITRCGATYARDGFAGGVEFDADDRLCLDGQRLMNVKGYDASPYFEDGAVYHTEIESWKLITATGTCGAGPCGFSVQDGDGGILQYGTTDGGSNGHGAQFLAVDAPGGSQFGEGDALQGTVRAWAVATSTDRNGNQIRFTYSDAPLQVDGTVVPSSSGIGANYISRVDYSANSTASLEPQRSIQIFYEPRDDVGTDYQAGAQVTMTARLSSIVSCLAADAVSGLSCLGDDVFRVASYDLTYCDEDPTCQSDFASTTGRSVLASIQQCGASGTTCLPTTNFGWQAGSNTIAGIFGANSGLNTSATVCATTEGVTWADFNGDGLLDWICSDYSDSGAVKVLVSGLSSSDGQQLAAPAGANSDGTLVGVSAVCQDGVVEWTDFTGEGMVDWVCFDASGDFYVWQSTGVTLTPIDGATSSGQLQSNDEPINAQCPTITDAVWADINGDSFSDWLCTASSGQKVYVLLSDGQTLTDDAGAAPTSLSDIIPISLEPNCGDSAAYSWTDFNGDMLADWTCTDIDIHTLDVYLASVDGSGQISLQSASASSEQGLVSGTISCPGSDDDALLQWADVNGDGRGDWTCTSTSEAVVSVLLSTATQLISPSSAPDGDGDTQPYQQNLNCGEDAVIAWLDFNGDGRDDWVCFADGVVYPWLSDGTKFVDPTGGVGLPGDPTCLGSDDHVFWGDFNGDLMVDWICNNLPTDGSSDGSVNVMVKAPPNPDLLTQISNGVGAVVTIRYDSLTNPEVYGQTQATDYPDGEVLGYPGLYSRYRAPFQVVSGYSLANDSAVNSAAYSYDYSVYYTNGVIGLHGLGWQGFETMTIYEGALGNNLDLTFLQDFPFTGRLSAVSACTATAADQRCLNQGGDQSVLFTSATSYYCQAGGCEDDATFYPLGENGRVYQVLADSTSVTHVSFGFTLSKQSTFDQFGNVILDANLGDTANGGQPLYTCALFQNDTDNWLIGFSQQQKQSSAAGCPGNTASDWSGYSYSAADGDMNWRRTNYDGAMNIASVMQWDDRTDDWIGHAATARDSVGNVTQIAVAKGAADQPDVVTATTYSLSYDATYQSFLESVTTPAALPDDSSSVLTMRRAVDARFGQVIGTEGPNGDVQLTCLDDFGATMQSQGPVGGTGEDANCLSKGDASGFLTATASADFLSATVTTLSRSFLAVDASAAGGPAVYQMQQTRLQWDNAFDNAAVGWSKSYIDGLSRPVRHVAEGDAANMAVDIAYTSRKRVSQISRPYADGAAPAEWTSVHFDAYGRKVRITTPYQGGDTTATPAATPCSDDDIGDTTTICWTYSAPNTTAQIVAANTGEPLTTSRNFSFFAGQPQITALNTQNASPTTSFTRDALGRIVSVTDPLGAQFGRGLDSLGRISSASDDAGATSSYTYNDIGQLLTGLNARGDSFRYAYDGLGRMTSIEAFSATDADTPTQVVRYSYDGAETAAAVGGNLKGRLSAAALVDPSNPAGASAYTFSYDSYGQISQQVLSLAGESLTTVQAVTPVGAIASIAYPGSQKTSVTYDYSDSGSLTSITGNSNGIANEFRAVFGDPAVTGKPQSVTYGNGATEAYRFSSAAQVLSHQVAGPAPDSPTLLSSALVRSHQGDIMALVDCGYSGNGADPACADIGTSTSDQNSGQSFTYTSGRLVTASGPYGAESYAYHDNGNMTALGGVTYTYETTAEGAETYRIASGDNGFSASYDELGNMTAKTSADGTQWGYAFDTLGRLGQVSRNGTAIARYTYDFQGNRLTKTVFGADGVTVAATVSYAGKYWRRIEADGAKSESSFLLDGIGPFALIPDGGDGSAGYYLHRDPVKGSTQLATDAVTGDVLAQFHYRPYGLAASETFARPLALPFRFEGHELDEETGLYYFGARYYDPEIGRFISADNQLATSPYGQDAFNRYALDLNDPVLFSDPDGHRPGCTTAASVISVGGFVAGSIIGGFVGAESEDKKGLNITAGVFMGGATGTAMGVPVKIFCEGAARVTDRLADGALGDLARGGRDALRTAGDGMMGFGRGLSQTIRNRYEAFQLEAQRTDLQAQVEQLEKQRDELLNPGGCDRSEEGFSFVAGTPVAFADGAFKPVEAIRIGDIVLGYDEPTGAVGPYRVADRFERTAPGTLLLAVGEEVIEATPEHPFWIEGRGWVRADELSPGDRLKTLDGSLVSLVSVQARDNEVRVYNISVEQAESYFVGQTMVLTHNQSCPKPDREAGDGESDLAGGADSSVVVDEAPVIETEADVAVGAFSSAAETEAAGDLVVAGATEASADIGLEIFADSLFVLLLM